MASNAIEQIKQKLDIVTEIGAVVALKRSGKSYLGLCPFHNERTPSFYVSPETRTWNCFGCHERGDIFTFVGKQQGLDFPETLALLGEKAGVNVGLGFDDEPYVVSATAQARTRLRAMNDSAAVWFHYQLLHEKSATYARSYLHSRAINDESIERFRLGYAPDGDSLTKYLLGQGYTEDEVVDAGLARRREGDRAGLYDYFRNRLIFTIRDGREMTIGFGARELGGGHPKYLNTPQTILFDKSATLYGFDLAREAARRQDQIVVVEGYVDALIAHQYGYQNTVACIGSAITTKHVQMIKKVTRRLVLALDPDAAGEAATMRAIEIAQEGFDRVLVPVPMPATPSAPQQWNPQQGRGKRKKDETPQGMIKFEEQVDADIRVLKLPDGVDPDEFITQNPSAWGEALQNALPLMDFYFDSLLVGLDLHAPGGKAEAGKRLLPLLATMGDRVKQDAYVRRLASLLRIDERDAQKEMQRYRRQRVTTHTAPPDQDTSAETSDVSIGDKYQITQGTDPRKKPQNSFLEDRTNTATAWEEHCLGLLLSNPGVLSEVYAILELSDFWGTETRALYTILTSAGELLMPSTLDALLASLPPILTSEAERLKALYAGQPQLDRLQLARTAKQIALRLKKLRLSDAITEISYLQREAEAQGDLETLRMLKGRALHLTIARGALDSARLLQN